MHGREGERSAHRGHMCPVLAPGAAVTVVAALPQHPAPSSPAPAAEAAAACSDHGSPDSFLKDGRKICVGDCALFRAGNSPPFVGIIRWISPGKEGYLKLGVNWLYRPSAVKLAKGILLETAPNEVFYSFHKDEISAESLLHPCKVAFLGKGVELPPGISSFVCRRVYDIANKCLWWLTDKDYINEHQEEVDHLLDKTRIEMHAAVQSGGRSPKQLNVPSTQQLKSGSDSVQSNNTLFSSQAKGKKRCEKGDQGSESKRECSLNADDKDSNNLRLDSMIKTQLAKITDKSGLINNDAVQKMVQLMQLDRGERKIDSAGRLLLADVIAATERNDCLGRFVQLSGVQVLDNWLQEAHRGKNGDGSGPKEGDKSVEELLLALLRALDKLPVNLNALQTCNIGKSVYHLRSHKNLEIQKKARSLVDIWKKRVDAEMTKSEMTKLSDAKSIGSSHTVSWPGKAGLSEASHGGNGRAGSSDVAVKGSITQLSMCKSLPVKIGQGDSNVKSGTASSGSLKWSTTLSTAVAIGTKDLQSNAGGSIGDAELQLTIIREENSNSCQPQTNSQPCSNDHAKTMGTSWKETRSSTSGLTNATKTSGGASRQRKPLNGLAGTGSSSAPDGGLVKSNSLSRNTSENLPQSGLSGERVPDVAIADHGNSHRLIVRLPNCGRSPARRTSGGSFEDHSVAGSITSSPTISEKNDHIDRKIKLKSDVCHATISADVNTESRQIDDVKGVVGSGNDDRTPALLDDLRNTVETGNEMEILVVASSSEPKSGKPFEASLNSINALIESCVKYSETGVSLYGGDDLGMNLLASVAAGEMSKSGSVSSTGSPRDNSDFEDPFSGNEVKSKISSDDAMKQVGRPEDNAEYSGSEKHGSTAASLQVLNETQQNCADNMTKSCGDQKCTLPLEEMGDHREQYFVSSAAPCRIAEFSAKLESKLEVETDRHVSSSTLPGSEEDAAYRFLDKRKASGPVTDALPNCKLKARSSSDESQSVDTLHESIAEGSMPLDDANDVDHVVPVSRKSEKESVEGTSSCPLDKQNVADGGLADAISIDQQLPSAMAICRDDLTGDVENAMIAAASVTSEIVDESKKEKSDSMTVKNTLEPGDNERKDHTNLAATTLDDRICSSVLSTSGNLENLENDVANQRSSASACHEEPTVLPICLEQCEKSVGSKLSGAETDVEKVSCSMEASSGQDPSGKCDFDLNEGFSGDDGNAAEQVTSSLQGYSSVVHMPKPSSFTIAHVSGSSTVPVTVAAPAKGPFVPPDGLLKSKGEPGWKGSAATSAFRPAEPRKVQEMAVGTLDVPSSNTTAGEQSHPPLNIDLNVPDERVLEDIASAQETATKSGLISNHDAPMRSSGGLDLDLNRADGNTENGQVLSTTNGSLGVPLLPTRPASGGFPLGEAGVLRDFDLNNGPSLDVGLEQLPQGQHTKGSTLPFLPSLRMNSNEPGNLSSWFPPGNSYPAVAIPSFLPDRGDHPFSVVAAPGAQRILGSSTGGSAFGSDLYRGSVLTPSPAVAFPPTAAFSYPTFPFGSSFPLASTSFSGGPMTYVDSAPGGRSFPAIPTPLMGPVAVSASPYARPFVISLPDSSTSGGSESSRKWGQQGLDLNAGPGSIDVEGRDERLASRQLSVASSQAFAEEQVRIYQAACGGTKRKVPEGGWDAERLIHKPTSWQ